MKRRKTLLPKLKELRDKSIKAHIVLDKIYANGNEFVEYEHARGHIKYIKCISWNIHCLNACSDDNEFLNIVNDFDIVFLCETW